MGFGFGAFGQGPFGQSDWAKKTLWDSLPQLYRSADADHGGLLESNQAAVGAVMDDLRNKIQNFQDLRNSDKVPTASDDTEIEVVLGRIVPPNVAAEQTGIAASINSSGLVTCQTGRFDRSSIGKRLEITNSSISTNNTTVKISSVYSSNQIYTYPVLSADSGVSWALRPAEDPSPTTTTVEVHCGDISNVRLGWYVWDGSSGYDVIGRSRFDGPLDIKHATYKAASDGVFAKGQGSTNMYLFSKAVTFDNEDFGRVASVSASPVVFNTRHWILGQLCDPSDIPTALAGYSGISLQNWNEIPTADAGPFYFAVMHRHRLVLDGNVIPRSLLEREGSDLTITNAGLGTVHAPSGAFTASDVGKPIRFWGAKTIYAITDQTIASVQSSTDITLNAAIPASGATLHWQIRSSSPEESSPYDLSDLDGGPEVDVYPPNLLGHLAEDFGSHILLTERELRQRQWIRHLIDWMDRKGTSDAYKIIGELSGYTVQPQGLYSTSLGSPLGSLVPANAFYEISDAATGRYGSTGSLTLSGGKLRFTDSQALFSATDTGRSIRITGTYYAINAKRYTIDSVVDSHTVEFLDSDYSALQVLPDSNNSSLSWSILKLLTGNAPTFPLFDDVNIDLMQLYNIYDSFGVDVPSWDPYFNSKMDVTISAVSGSTVTTKDLIALDYYNLAGGNLALNDVITDTTSGFTAKVIRTPPFPDIGRVFLEATAASGSFTVGGGASSHAGALTLTISKARLGTSGVVGFVDNTSWTLKDSNGTVAFLSQTPVLTNAVQPNTYQYTYSAPVALVPGTGILQYTPPITIKCGYCTAPFLKFDIAAKTGALSPDITVDSVVNRLLDAVPAHVGVLYDSGYGPQTVGSTVPTTRAGPTVAMGYPRLNDVAAIFCTSRGSLWFADRDFTPNRVYRVIDILGNVKTKYSIKNTGIITDGPIQSATTADSGIEDDLVVDSNGNIIFTDVYGPVVRKITPEGIVSTIAGRPGISGYTDGAVGVSTLTYPTSLAIDGSDNVYVYDGEISNATARIRKISPAGVVSTMKDPGNMPINAAHSGPICLTDDGRIIFTSYISLSVLQYDLATSVVSTLFGTTHPGLTLMNPYGLAYSTKNKNIMLYDSNRVISINKDGSFWFLGTAGVAGDSDVIGAETFDDGSRLTADTFGNFYIHCALQNTIRRISENKVVNHVAGITGNGGINDY